MLSLRRRGRFYYGPVRFKFYVPPGEFDVTGGSFTSSFSADFGMDADGGSFNSSLVATLQDTSIEVSGGAFTSSIDASFGADVNGGAFSTTLASTLSDTAYYTVTGGAFSSELSATILGTELLTVSGGSFTSLLEGHFGADVVGGTFATALSATISSPHTLSVSGGAFVSTLSSAVQDIGLFAVTGGNFNTTMLSFDVAGGAFNSSLSATITNTVAHAIAYALNIRTGESTRYTNYTFDYIIHVGDKPYGVKSDGLYLLEGSTDNGTAINGTITTKNTDFGSFQSKRCEYVYLNSDTSTTITPIVDDVRKKAHASAFGGRRTKMSLGNAGRYWQFEITGISKLEGAEFMPQSRQSRVK